MQSTSPLSPHIVFSVVNDLNYDQRMQRICNSLVEAGYRVTLIGRELAHSKPLKNATFNQKRFKLWFTKGKLFYIEYNLRLLWHFLWNKYDIFGGIDLDTLSAHFLAARLKGQVHTYDAHEYFAELPEVVHRPFVRWVWKSVERYIVPRTRYAYTINQSYANLFKHEYGVDFEIVRNATVLRPLPSITKDTCYILYQGAVNVGRGVEEMICAMPYIDKKCKLYICGKGDVFEDCVQLVEQLNLTDRVVFWGFVEPAKLRQFTLKATIGFTFFTNDGMSYYASLANRFFDYFHNGIPQLCVNFPEYARINKQHNIALMLDNLQPQTIAQAANKLLQQPDLYTQMQQNCLTARKTINWQAEAKKLVAIYQNIMPATTVS